MAKRTHYNISLPTTWDEITLKDFVEIKQLYDKYDNNVPIIALLSHLSGKDEKYFKDAPALVITKMLERIAFLRTPLPLYTSSTITVDDDTYVINNEEELKFGEFVDAQTIIENNPDNFAALLAVVCRKPDEAYDDDYIAKTFQKRVKMFEKQPMTKIQPLINFFLESWSTSRIISPSYSRAMIDQANHILQHCDNLVKNGAGSKFSIWWRRKKLKTLRKQLKHIAAQFSHISATPMTN